MKKDTYGEVINSQDTYREIAGLLKEGTPVFIGWTDQQMTHFDILFSYHALGEGTHQGGVKPYDLFVSIMGVGAFGFDPKNTDTYPGYYEEKLARRSGLGSTADKLAELINGIKGYL